MLLERLLFTSCLLPGRTKFKEGEAQVEILPEQGETILFFCIDDQSKGNSESSPCKLRKDLWGDQQGQRICDLLVFYAKEDRRVLCFVELKESISDLGGATKQVINTYRAIKTELKYNYVAQAFLIGHHGSTPTEKKRYQDRLEKEFGNNFRYNAKPNEFAAFLRGSDKPESPDGRRKRKRRR